MSKETQPFEASLQDLVYSVDVSAGTRLLRTFLFSAFILVLMVLITAREFRGFDSPHAMDTAQLARNLAETGRYETRVVRPVSMAAVAEHRSDNDPRVQSHPELFRPPMVPALLAGAFRFYDLIGINLFPSSRSFEGMRVYPAEQWVIIPIHHFFTAMSGILLYLLGSKLFSKKTGLLAVITYFLMEPTWSKTLDGDGLPILLFFTMAAFYFAVCGVMNRQEGRSAWSWANQLILSAACCAGAVLSHYAALVIIPGIVLYLVLSGPLRARTAWTAFLFCAVILLLLSPWVVRNVQQSGRIFGLAPYTALQGTGRFADQDLMRTLDEELHPAVAFQAGRSKSAGNAAALFDAFLAAPGAGVLTGFFFVTFFYRFVRPQVHRLRWGIGLSLLLLFAGIAFFNGEAVRLIHLMRPLIVLYGIAFFLILLDRLDFNVPALKSAVTSLVIGTAALPLIVTLFLAQAPGMPYPPYHVPFIMRVTELLQPNETICSDMPWATAWYGRRTSILLPQNVMDFFQIADYEHYISGLYITTLTKDQPFVSRLLDGPDRTWLPVMMGRTEGFPLRHGFALHRQDQLFLTDSVRWQTGEEERRP